MLGIYTRLSKDDPESNSPEHQLREGKEFAKKKNFKKYEHYDEGIGKSGGLEIKDRPALQRLVDDIKSGIITAVWMRNQNRLERNVFTFHTFAEVAKENNLDVYFGDNAKVDYNNPASVLQGGLMSQFSQYKKDQQGYNTRKTLKANMNKGLVHGVIPYGYKKDENRKMIIDKEEAKVVKLIFKLSLEGHGYGAIAKELNKEKHPTRYGKFKNKDGTLKHKNLKWDKGTIQGLMKNEVYKGIRKMKNGDVYKVEPILDAFYFDRVRNHLKDNMTSGAKKVEHEYLLNGINVCGVCGKGFNGRVIAPKNNKYYQCVTKRFGKNNCGNLAVKMDVVDNIIWNMYFENKYILQLLNTKINEEMVLHQYAKYSVKWGEYEEEKKEQLILQKEVIKLRASGELTKSEVRGTLDDIENNIDKLNEKIFDTKIKHQEANESLANIWHDNKDFDGIEKVIAFDDKKILIKKYIKKITLTKMPKQNIKLKVGFIAPNIKSHSITIERLYKWYSYVENNMKFRFNI